MAMTRADAHLDAMLRHLGAAYYESLHGRAARSDVARALDTVEEHSASRGRCPQAPPGPASPGTQEAPVGPAGQRPSSDECVNPAAERSPAQK